MKAKIVLEYISNYELQTCSAMRHDWYERKSSTRSDYELISKVLRTPHHCLRRVAINNRQDVQLLPFHESKVTTNTRGISIYVRG